MKIESIRTTPLLAPLSRPLTNASGIIEKVPLVLVDLVTDAGITGRAYVLVYFPQLLKGLNETVLGLGEMVKGMNVVPREINAALHRRTRLLGTKNLVGMALAGIDMAAWDAFARAQKLPLAELLGGTRRPLPTYNSLGLYNAKTIPQACEETLARGFAGMKVKTGWPNFADDLGAVREAKKRLGDKVALMIDFNQSLTRAEALARCRALDDEGLVWIEEPIAADDHIGCAQIAVEIKTPIQIGENFQGPFDMANALRANAADFVMPDPQMIQGVTGWLDAATVGEFRKYAAYLGWRFGDLVDLWNPINEPLVVAINGYVNIGIFGGAFPPGALSFPAALRAVTNLERANAAAYDALHAADRRDADGDGVRARVGVVQNMIAFTPADPAPGWNAQLAELDLLAQKSYGKGFAEITVEQRRTVLRAPLEGVRLPRGTAAGTHVAAALLAHWTAASETIDLAYRAMRAGWERWYVPEAVVEHAYAAVIDKRWLSRHTIWHARGMARFVRRHPEILRRR